MEAGIQSKNFSRQEALLGRHVNNLEAIQIKTNPEQYCCQPVYSGKLLCFFFGGGMNINDTKPRLHHCVTKSVVAFSRTSPAEDLPADGSYFAARALRFWPGFTTINIEF